MPCQVTVSKFCHSHTDFCFHAILPVTIRDPQKASEYPRPIVLCIFLCLIWIQTCRLWCSFVVWFSLIPTLFDQLLFVFFWLFFIIIVILDFSFRNFLSFLSTYDSAIPVVLFVSFSVEISAWNRALITTSLLLGSIVVTKPIYQSWRLYHLSLCVTV